MVAAVDDHDLATAQALDDGYLPERPAMIERAREDPHHLGAQLGRIAGRFQENPADVLAEIEVGVVDPDRVVEVEGHERDLLPIPRHQVEAIGDRILDANCAMAAGKVGAWLEDVDGADVERRVGALRVEEPGIARAEWLEEGCQVRVCVIKGHRPRLRYS
jgi:hypothetical protein